ncbi:MGH1-like glycoside hydrolase domain-containing protein [Dactylosporangium siamense]|uniref:alpha-L-rhamnosidase-related protein n=1 Tax=Dactylosporangium siamense TaxID=685454 RepID=UPI002FED0518
MARRWLVTSAVLLLAASAMPGPVAAVAAPPAAVPAAAVPAAAVPAAAPAYNYSPTSRTVAPVAVFRTTGSVTNPQNVLSGSSTRLSGAGAALSLDFGKEVGGHVTLHFAGASGANQQVGLAFSESSQYVGTSSDASNGGGGADGALTTTVGGATTYTTPAAQQRGGFRYLTVFLSSAGWVDLDRVSLAITFAPGKADPSAYPNFFRSDDDLLNRIWAAGAYTVQTNTISPTEGRVWGPPGSGWNNGATVGVGTSVLVDGAKRDRTVWPGDLGISLPTQYASTNDLISTRNALTTLFQHQSASGELPYAGPQVNFYGSDTYHTWTLVGTSSYYLYSGDKTWLDGIWAQYKQAMTFICGKIDGNGLLSVTGTADWARSGQGGENIEANAILYEALTGGAVLATAEGDSALAATYRSRAATLKTAANARLWDAAVDLYRDSPGSTMYPQDGNSLAVWFGLTDTLAKAQSIAGNLASRWNQFGAPTPEKGNAIGTFPGSMEVQAHFAAGDDHNGLALIRREWGYMLNSPLGTGSTFWEGFNNDGTFDYGGSYLSLAHGWATGPTSALTFSVLGLAPDKQLGSWRFVPHPGDLSTVEGRITLPQGALNGSWSRDVGAGTFTSHVDSPNGTVGTIGVPKLGGGNVTVSVNGTVVWADGAFLGGAGLTGASQDHAYVYLTGVSAGGHDVTATGISYPADLPAGYTRCAGDGETCPVTAAGTVAFGAGAYVTKTVSTGAACTAATFGDPAVGVRKSCYSAPQGGPSGWSTCAAENGTCSFSGPRMVAYGANGAFATRLVTGGTACANAVFGDPLFGVAKSCYTPPAGGPAPGWTQCAAENGTCTVTGVRTVAYGANGAFAYTAASGQLSCGNGTFGDPVSGVAKACYVRTGAPAGYATVCAAERGTCSFTGTRTVAFGAGGRFVYQTFTGGTACTGTAFGRDPIFGVAKSCYLTP